MKNNSGSKSYPFIVNVVESPEGTKPSAFECIIGDNIRFNIDGIRSYFFAEWHEQLFDALLVAAAIEFADRIHHRPSITWARQFEVHIPVHDPDRWNAPSLNGALIDCIQFLTGDKWNIQFQARKQAYPQPDGLLPLEANVEAVIPFSNGLDSFVVSNILKKSLGDKLVRIRLGSLPNDHSMSRSPSPIFNAIPYHVTPGDFKFVESSVRSRGFKFLLMAGIAAYLAKAKRVIIPESGQGVFGPVLVPVGQAYEDYRNHPLFTGKLERFLELLLETRIQYEIPYLWHTKGESLREWLDIDESKSFEWRLTRSCWQNSRQISVDHKNRQCGICAACMLRRLAIFSAGVKDVDTSYAFENLKAHEFIAGFAPGFPTSKITNALRDYAIAGTLHLEEFSSLPCTPSWETSRLVRVQQLSDCLNISNKEVMMKLDRLLQQHSSEWALFKLQLGSSSFINKWIGDA